MFFQAGISRHFRKSQINERSVDEGDPQKMSPNAYLASIARESPIIIRTVVKALDNV
jgi:hypothetical protein